MVEPKNDEPKRGSFMHRLQEDERFNRGYKFLQNGWVELLSGFLMFLGIILAFFYRHIGGMCVGLALGIYFFSQIKGYFFYVRGAYTKYGLFKTLMCLGTLLYFLIAIPAFTIAVVLGFGIIFLIRRFL